MGESRRMGFVDLAVARDDGRSGVSPALPQKRLFTAVSDITGMASSADLFAGDLRNDSAPPPRRSRTDRVSFALTPAEAAAAHVVGDNTADGSGTAPSELRQSGTVSGSGALLSEQRVAGGVRVEHSRAGSGTEREATVEGVPPRGKSGSGSAGAGSGGAFTRERAESCPSSTQGDPGATAYALACSQSARPCSTITAEVL